MQSHRGERKAIIGKKEIDLILKEAYLGDCARCPAEL